MWLVAGPPGAGSLLAPAARGGGERERGREERGSYREGVRMSWGLLI